METEVLARCATNCGTAYASLAGAMGRPSARWDDALAGDLGLGQALPPNSATLLRPLEGIDLEDALDRIHGFFAENPGGGYQVWSLWPTVDLHTRGYDRDVAPCMVLPAGAHSRPPAPELRIVEVDDGAGIRDAATLWIESFGVRDADPGELVDERALDAWRMWVGYVEGVPVSTSAAIVSDGMVGIYAVATSPPARRRGYGEALTWAAARSDDVLPATLQASTLGAPVDARMGFRTVGSFTIWTRER